MSSEPSLPPTRLDRVSPADAVVLREIIDDRLGILRRDRSAEDVGHFVYLGLPSLAIEKPQIGTQIVEAVAGAAVAFDRLPPGGLCEKYRLFVGACARRGYQNEDKPDERGFHDPRLTRR